LPNKVRARLEKGKTILMKISVRMGRLKEQPLRENINIESQKRTDDSKKKA